jgi:hypothetical protein
VAYSKYSGTCGGQNPEGNLKEVVSDYDEDVSAREPGGRLKLKSALTAGQSVAVG